VTTPTAPSLRQVVAARHPRLSVGTAVGSLFSPATRRPAVPDRPAREFNVLTAENEMKFSSLQPTRARPTATRADSMVAFARANGNEVRGHTLPGTACCRLVASAASRRTRREALLDDHIRNVVGHSRDRGVGRGERGLHDGAASFVRASGRTRLGREYVEQASAPRARPIPKSRCLQRLQHRGSAPSPTRSTRCCATSRRAVPWTAWGC
jgi:hypothetical protein